MSVPSHFPRFCPAVTTHWEKSFGGALKRAEAVCLQDGVLMSINKRKAFFCRLMGIQIRLMRDCHKRSTNDVMCIVGATDGYHERNLH